MSTIPVKRTPEDEPAESTEEKFRRLAAAWTAETAYVSSTTDLVAHPAFQEIVGMGPAAIPLLLRELENGTGHWRRALRRITGVDPVPPADRGNIAKTAELGQGARRSLSCTVLPPGALPPTRSLAPSARLLPALSTPPDSALS
jgi:hypothetical protein